ncbi:MAG TPA: peptidoglycan-binding domain-containing protein [Puia sp.]|nr:peptidoglycan-binding domain-containing protein [Puia sp.]
MSYRSRLYNHRNAQPPEGEKKKKPFFSSKHRAGAADDHRKFFHTAAGASEEPPQVQRLATSGIDEKKGTTEEKEARNKGDKLREDKTGGTMRDKTEVGTMRDKTEGGTMRDETEGGTMRDKTEGGTRDRDGEIQRQLVIPPVHPDAVAPELTPQQIRDAIVYNNNRYGEGSVRQMQTIVEATVSGVMDEDTVRKIAFYQAKYDQEPDGKIGPDTLRQLHAEMGAKGAPEDDCINYFLIRVGELQVTTVRPGRVRIKADVNVDIHFDAHCDCSTLQYRQFVSGTVTKNGVNINHWLNQSPGGRLPAMGGWREDGNNSQPAGAPYGHRNLPPNVGDVVDQYSDPDGTLNMRSGCMYENSDSVGIEEGDGVAGDNFVLDIRFIGEIRKNGKPIEKKFWAVRGRVTI